MADFEHINSFEEGSNNDLQEYGHPRSVSWKTRSLGMTESTTSATFTSKVNATTTAQEDRSHSFDSDTNATSISAPLLHNPADFISQHQAQPFQLMPIPSPMASPGRRPTTTTAFQRRKSLLQHQHPQPIQIRLLRLVWIVTLILGEHGLYWILMHRCAWPENRSWDMSQSALHGRYRIVVIADPQLTDWFSYKQTGIGLWLTEFYTDLFMRRSFRRLHARFQPDAVLFLGDLLDGGRETMDQPRFERNKWRFYERVFDTTWTGWNLSPVIMDLEEEEEGLGSYDENLEPQHRDWSRENHRKDMVEPDLDRGENKDTGAKTVNKDNHGEIDIGGNYSQRIDIPLDAEERSRIRSGGRSVRLYVAGNHDYGFGDTIIRNAVKRYKRDFGSINYELQIGNHTLVVLDTLALSSNITSIRAESQEFLTHISKEEPTSPRILFTHIPLFRLDSTFCGEPRESKRSIVDGHGEQYQNLVNSTLSKEILRGIRPDMVFSGDDHDWCEIAHDLDQHLTPEVTLPTFSFAQGVQQPGFVLLSLYNPENIRRNRATMFPTTEGTETSSTSDMVHENMGIRASLPLDVATVSDESTFAYEECLLPKQLAVYDYYILLLLLTIGWLLILRFRWIQKSRRQSSVDSSLLVQWRQQPTQSSSSSTEGEGDGDNGDWEENEKDNTFLSTQGSTTATQLSPQQPQWSRLSLHSPSAEQTNASTEYIEEVTNSCEKFGLGLLSPSSSTTTVGTNGINPIPFSPSFRRTNSSSSTSSASSVQSSPVWSPLTKRKRRLIGKGIRQGNLRMISTWCWGRIRPLRTRLFWRMVFWDLWSIFRFVLPFYAVLLFVSLM